MDKAIVVTAFTAGGRYSPGLRHRSRQSEEIFDLLAISRCCMENENGLKCFHSPTRQPVRLMIEHILQYPPFRLTLADATGYWY